MTPLYFGSGERRLFGLYESGRPLSRKTNAVLFCHAWGSEHVNSYRAIRFAARRFVAAGFCALRFDYYGTGDSEGESTDADLCAWERDIEAAIDELRELAQTRSVALFGLRLGATLAARVAARAPEAVSRLALWDPIVIGANYVESLAEKARRRRGALAPRRSPAFIDGDPIELDGLRVSYQFVSALRAIDLAETPPTLPAETIIVNTLDSARRAEAAPLQPSMPPPPGGATLSSDAPPPYADVLETASALPVDAVEQIIGRWL